ncbi:MAG: 30S ribosomal protein S5 [Cyanophyceae cyanobacterium]|jgi:small subunit ribosomal protein S5|nr:30S ribosomal protein S5 [Synechococcaceae cyanobacterium SM2_3_2]
MAEQQRERRRGRNKSRETRESTEWQERVVQIRRVTKVVKGGKQLSFRAVVIVGNEQGQVGVGVGKAKDVIGAVKKGVVDGKKHLVEVPLTSGLSVPHPMRGIGGGAAVLVMPAAPGTGVIAGGAVRSVLELAGVRNSLAKQLGSSNPLNNARATIDALSRMRTFEAVAEERGISVDQLRMR